VLGLGLRLALQRVLRLARLRLAPVLRLARALALARPPLAPGRALGLVAQQVLAQQAQQGLELEQLPLEVGLEQREQRALRQLQVQRLEPLALLVPRQLEQRLVLAHRARREVQQPSWQQPSSLGWPHRWPQRHRCLARLTAHRPLRPRPSWLPSS